MAEFYLGWKGLKKTLEGRVPGELTSLSDPTKEEKAAVTRGLSHVGKQTFQQYEILVSNGYAGNVVMKWSAHKSHQEIVGRGLKLNPEQLRGVAARAKGLRSMTSCPICQVTIRRDRLVRHEEECRKRHLAKT